MSCAQRLGQTKERAAATALGVVREFVPVWNTNKETVASGERVKAQQLPKRDQPRGTIKAQSVLRLCAQHVPTTTHAGCRQHQLVDKPQPEPSQAHVPPNHRSLHKSCRSRTQQRAAPSTTTYLHFRHV